MLLKEHPLVTNNIFDEITSNDEENLIKTESEANPGEPSTADPDQLSFFEKNYDSFFGNFDLKFKSDYEHHLFKDILETYKIFDAFPMCCSNGSYKMIYLKKQVKLASITFTKKEDLLGLNIRGNALDLNLSSNTSHLKLPMASVVDESHPAGEHLRDNSVCLLRVEKISTGEYNNSSSHDDIYSIFKKIKKGESGRILVLCNEESDLDTFREWAPYDSLDLNPIKNHESVL